MRYQHQLVLAGIDVVDVPANGSHVELSRVDLNLLVAFDALMSERSVTRAARRLYIGQSAMSSTLGRLRKMLGDQLLVRDGRGLVPTPLAEALEAPVRDALSRVESILTTASGFDPSTDTRTFTVMASDYVTVTFIHALLTKLHHQAPQVRLRVRPWADDFEEQLRRNQVDLGIMPREVFPSYTDYRHEVLFCDRWVCAVDVNHPDIGDRITLQQFSELPYLATSPVAQQSFVEMQLDLQGVTRRTAFTAGFGIAPFLLRDTRLITLIPRRLADRFSHVADIRLLEPPMFLPPLSETMLWNPRNDDDFAHRWLRQRMIELASDRSELAPTRCADNLNASCELQYRF